MLPLTFLLYPKQKIKRAYVRAASAEVCWITTMLLYKCAVLLMLYDEAWLIDSSLIHELCRLFYSIVTFPSKFL